MYFCLTFDNADDKNQKFFYQRLLNMTVTLIGVAGASGSGKTTVATELLNHYGSDQCIIISSDNYYKGLDGIPIEKRHEYNFDHPDSIDFELLADHLGQLKLKRSVEIPTYDFAISARTRETVLIVPKRLIIVEGILVLHPQNISNLLDTKIFVKSPADLCFIRRLVRDTTERGRTADQVILQYENTVRPMYTQYVNPCKRDADLVIDNSSKNIATADGLRFDMSPVTTYLDAIMGGKKSSTQQRHTLFSKPMPPVPQQFTPSSLIAGSAPV